MIDEDEILPWRRLQKLFEMPEPGRRIHAMQWANELMSRHGAAEMSGYIGTAYRDTVTAVLLSLVDDQTLASYHGGGPKSFASQASGAPSYSSRRSGDVLPSVIRAWAQEKGISISDRGRIPMWVINRYHTEHADQDSEKPLSYKIRAALEQHGELTKSELWDVIGRNHSAEEIEDAFKYLPNVQVVKGESSGGRPPVIFRLVEEEANEIDEPAATAGRQPKSLRGVDGASPLAGDSSDLDTADSKIHDFLQILRGESRSG